MTRLGIGPINSAGQAHRWAEAVRTYTNADAFSFGFAGAPGRRGSLATSFTTEITWPHPRLTPGPVKAWLVASMLRRAGGCTHLAVDSFASLFGRLGRSHVGLELGRLRRSHPHLAVALVAHGSDLRDPDLHRERLPQSYYATAPEQWVEHLRATAARNRRTVADSGLPLFVSTPDLLLEDVGGVPATWLPVTVDPATWSGGRIPLSGQRPVVLHLPSRRTPAIKGTDVIDPVLRELDRAGSIRYLSPAQVAPAEVPDLVRRCDVLIEQVRSGYYSVAAVEGMAAGRIVLSSLAPDVQALMPQQPPLIDVPDGGLAGTLMRVLAEPEWARRLAAAGPDFVDRWHDGRAAAASLAPWLGVDPPPLALAG